MKSIMIVDDDEYIREAVITVMKKEGYKVVGAEDGKTCLGLLNKQKFDLLILDVIMPKMSGWDLLKEIMRTKKEYKNKIMFLSVVDVSEGRKHTLLKGGIIDYVVKPFHVKDLAKKVKKALK